MQTVLTQRLGCKFPIVQTAMGWVADARLVAATANAGGFGFFAGATAEAGTVNGHIEAIKALTNAPFGVNFHMFQPNAEEVVEAVIRHKVAAVSYGRGPVPAMVKRLKDAGVICMPTVGALKHAVKAVELGADIVTVQGGEGGGHTGAVPTTILLPQVVDAVKVPVVAAGGFFDGRGLVAALAYGASGIAMGTRFLMTTESPVPQPTLNRYVSIKEAADIRVSTAVDGLPQRFIDNAELRRLEAMGWPKKLMMSLAYARAWGKEQNLSPLAMAKLGLELLKSDDTSFAQTVLAPNLPTLVQRAIVAGDTETGVLPSGQAAAAIDRLESCADLIARIMREAESRLAALRELSA